METGNYGLNINLGLNMQTNDKDLDRICQKVNKRILFLIVLMFCLAMLDRTNLSFVKEHLEIDAHINAVAYALGAGIFFIGYAIFEIPSNLFLHKFGAKIWLSRIMITWGLVTMGMIFIKGEISFYVLRFLLGITEAGFSPGIILYLSYFYPPTKRSKAYGYYQSGVPIAFIFGGIISGAILDYMPPIYFSNWQWMFLIEGAITVLVGIFAIFYLDNKPKNAKWLNKEEKEILILNLEKSMKNIREISIIQTFKNFIVWKFVFVYFCIQLSVYGVLFYLPVKISSFLGIQVGLKVGLLNAIVWIMVLICLPIITSYADKFRAWNKFAIILLIFATFSMCIAAISQNLIIFIIFITISAISFIVIQPIFWNLPTQVLSGKSAAAGIALIGSIGNLGGFVAPILKNYADSITNTNYAGLVILSIVAFLGVFVLIGLNKLKG